jgi:hypothetical protein
MRSFDSGRSTVAVWLTGGALALGLAVADLSTQPLLAQSSLVGQWRTLPYPMPINPIHLALTHDGKVLIVAGSGSVATETNFRAAVWDPAAGTFLIQSLAWDMFCNGMSMLPDGRVFINGGNLRYDPFYGEPRNAVFDPASGTFTDVENMAHGRWYPTVTTLGDGRVMTFSGLRESGGTNSTVEIYTMGSGWSPEYPAGWTPPLYPRLHLSTDGRVFYSGHGRTSRFFDPVTKTWTPVIATTRYGNSRNYGSSVLLPLRPADGYRPRVMILGGGNPGTATTEIIDLSSATPQWQFGPSMSQPRIQMNATLLPNGRVLALGGSTNDEDANTKSLNADLYDPATNTFSSAGANAYPRLYHSGSLLLPDATVMFVGGNPTRGTFEPHIEIYSPAYLFNADGTPAARPAITGITPGAFGYGQQFLVATPSPSSVSAVVLMRPGAPTHSIDMEQRLVGLNFTVLGGFLNVTAPPNGNIAPPGYYMLFVLNPAGVPSVARFVRLSPSIANQPPTAAILSPSTSVTVNPGGAVHFAGGGSDADGVITAHAWTFAGGMPASASVATPGNVVYSTPGAYPASLTVTDNGGLVSPGPATRTITVADFSLSATPGTRTATAGASTTYTASIGAVNGFTGTVGFAVSGLPAGATASFSPASIAGAGSTTLTIATTPATPTGSYVLTIAGTSGPRTRTITVQLVVSSATFSITASPTSRTIPRDAATTYAVSVPGGQGFVGSITLSVRGLPRHANGKFNPSVIVDAGSSTLTVSTSRRVDRGTYRLQVTGTSGGLVRSVEVTLIVQ